MGEFDLIETIRAAGHAADPGLRLGIGDDAAVVDVPDGESLVVTTDTLNSGIHFLPSTPAENIGHKALAVNLSDLAAMGARPRWVTLNLSLPEADQAWVDAFMVGFYTLAGRFGVSLVGGDTCAGPMSITVTALGSVTEGRCLTRAGARPGDIVLVSGHLGDAALALAGMKSGEPVSARLAAALERPMPRVELGRALAGVATACIDLSDGLLADLGHLCKASGLGARLDLVSLPASSGLSGLDEQTRWNLQLGGGDDYELCFTIDPAIVESLAGKGGFDDLAITRVGEMTPEEGIRCLTPDGTDFQPERSGFGHFN
jgi:thiamine-monophosphate kinase